MTVPAYFVCERFRALANFSVNVAPATDDALAVIFLNQAETGVTELDQRSTRLFAQPVLHVVRHRMRHHQRSAEFQQRRPLDGLHVRPKVSVVGAEIAIPAASRPRLQHHRHRAAIADFVPRAELFQQRGERILQRRVHMNLLLHEQREILNTCCCIYDH